MIGWLRGTVEQIEDDVLTLQVMGVGYEVICSAGLSGALGVGQTASVPVYTYVREDALSLFGFSDLAEKRLFLELLKVNGVGPKLALKVVGSRPVAELVDWIERGEVGLLAKTPRLGKKTAEQIILSLKGKLSERLKIVSAAGPRERVTGPWRQELVSALGNLGFKRQEIDFAMEKLDESLSLEEALKTSLQTLSKGMDL